MTILEIIASIATCVGLVALGFYISRWCSGVNADRDTLKRDGKVLRGRMRRVEQQLSKMFVLIEDIHEVLRSKITKPNSPLSLTEYGEKLAKDIDADKLAERYGKTPAREALL